VDRDPSGNVCAGVRSAGVQRWELFGDLVAGSRLSWPFGVACVAGFALTVSPGEQPGIRDLLPPLDHWVFFPRSELLELSRCLCSSKVGVCHCISVLSNFALVPLGM